MRALAQPIAAGPTARSGGAGAAGQRRAGLSALASVPEGEQHHGSTWVNSCE